MHYCVKTGLLTLQHRHPITSTLTVLVSVDAVVSTIQPSDVRVGEWINVIGYVTCPPAAAETGGKRSSTEVAFIQAIVLWSAGAIKLGQYESALDQRRKAERGVH